MSNTRRQYPLKLATAAAVLALLAGCATTAIDMIPSKAGGLPQNVPERPAVQPAFPEINDVPLQRADTPLSADEQKKLESDLTGLRQTQVDRANPPPPPAKAKPSTKQPAKQPTKQPAKQPIARPRKEAPPAARNP